MSFAELVLFVDGVGYSLAARSRDDMFIKTYSKAFCGIYFWKPFSDFFSTTCWGRILFCRNRDGISCRFKNKNSAMLGHFSVSKKAIFCKVAPRRFNIILKIFLI